MRLLLRLVPSRAVLYHVHLDTCWHLAADLHPVWSVKRFSLWHPPQEPWMIFGVQGFNFEHLPGRGIVSVTPVWWRIIWPSFSGNFRESWSHGTADRQPHEAMWFRNPKEFSFSGNLFQGYMMKDQGCKPACWPCVASLDSMDSASYSIRYGA